LTHETTFEYAIETKVRLTRNFYPTGIILTIALRKRLGENVSP
jgi:hypothetical protein